MRESRWVDHIDEFAWVWFLFPSTNALPSTSLHLLAVAVVGPLHVPSMFAMRGGWAFTVFGEDRCILLAQRRSVCPWLWDVHVWGGLRDAEPQG